LHQGQAQHEGKYGAMNHGVPFLVGIDKDGSNKFLDHFHAGSQITPSPEILFAVSSRVKRNVI